MENGDWEKALKYIKRAAELNPENDLVTFRYGYIEMQLENYEKAYELFHKAYYKNPQSPKPLFYLADVCAYLGRLEEAKKYAEKYISMVPETDLAQEAREIIEYVDYELDGGDERDEYSTEQYLLLEKARYLMDEGSFTEAIELFEQIIEVYPDFWKAYNNLSLAYFYVGDLEQSKALLNHVLRETNGNLQALCNLTIIAYYEKEDEKLEELVSILKKIHPLDFEDHYKLGATLALIGEYELAYKWLHSLLKQIAPSDPGFYYWLAQASYFSNRMNEAEKAWRKLIEIDPSKKGQEPWRNVINNTMEATLEQNRDYIIEKISSNYPAYRMFGFFLLSKSPYKEEIISHPKLINLSKYDGLENLCLAYALNHEFTLTNKLEAVFQRAMKVAEELYKSTKCITIDVEDLYQMWFIIFEKAFYEGYEFKNVKAICAALEYMYYSSLNEKKVTKKQYAEQYGVSASTLSKYVDQLIQFLPIDE